ncbi:MAG: type II toxin-antitoxin system RelE/ParE family toxin [bacterium]
MAEIRWTLQALADVDAIADYIANDSAYYAQIVVSKLFEAVCRIIYRLKETCSEIITVYHSSRLLNEDDVIGRSS